MIILIQIATAPAVGTYAVLSKDSQPRLPIATPRQSEAAELGAIRILLESVGDQAGGSVGAGYATASGNSAFGFGSAATVHHKKGEGLAIYVEPDRVPTR